MVKSEDVWPGGGLKEGALYYAGYSYKSLSDYGPIFQKACTESAKFNEPVADAIVKQLNSLGYSVVKEPVRA